MSAGGAGLLLTPRRVNTNFCSDEEDEATSNYWHLDEAHTPNGGDVERDRQEQTLMNLEAQLHKFWSGGCWSSMIHIFFNNVAGAEFKVAFISGSMLYEVEPGSTARTINIAAIVHAIKDDDDMESMREILAKYKEQLLTNSEREVKWNRARKVILVRQSVPCAFLFPDYFSSEFGDILRDLINFACDAKKIFKTTRTKQHFGFNTIFKRRRKKQSSRQK
jgi:hypothetical protein